MEITLRSGNVEELDETDFSSDFLFNPNIFCDFKAILAVKKGLFSPKMPDDVTMTSFLTSLSTSDEDWNPIVSLSFKFVRF